MIPSPKGEQILDWTIGNFHITNTVFSTWLFMGFLLLLLITFSIAIRTNKLPTLRAFGLDVVSRILAYTAGLLGDKKLAKRYVWLLG